MSDPVASGAGGGLGRRPPSLVGPLGLIALGLLFLLTNLGVLSPGVWDTLWRLWPFALIAVGVEVLVGRRTRWGGLAVLGFLWGVVTLALGPGQTQLLVGESHWVVQVAHLLIGLGAIALGAVLARRARTV